MTSTSVAGWDLHLLGGWQLSRDGAWVDVASRQKRLISAVALVGAHPRAYFASLLWPDSSEAHATGSLRTTLFETTRQLPSLVRVGAGSIALADDVTIDVDEVTSLIRSIHTDRSYHPADTAVDRIEAADLLPGWYEDWVIFAQERLTQQRISALELLAASSLENGDSDLAIRAAEAAIAIEPLRESSYLLLMRAHLLAGNRVLAAHTYRRIEELLDGELGVAPSPEFAALLTELRPP